MGTTSIHRDPGFGNGIADAHFQRDQIGHQRWYSKLFGGFFGGKGNYRTHRICSGGISGADDDLNCSLGNYSPRGAMFNQSAWALQHRLECARIAGGSFDLHLAGARSHVRARHRAYDICLCDHLLNWLAWTFQLNEGALPLHTPSRSDVIL